MDFQYEIIENILNLNANKLKFEKEKMTNCFKEEMMERKYNETHFKTNKFDYMIILFIPYLLYYIFNLLIIQQMWY